MQGTGTFVNDVSMVTAQLNESLDDVIALLEREIRRLETSLETYRLSSHPRRREIIRWHVSAIDERYDALRRVRRMAVNRTDRALCSEATRH